ncbi:hypothetical protein [Streptomyces sp. Ac-502]|uniref:hypothetical protein n=1 Tax=Streptomyces sp. Ac-502 TaxID=3342801 RepID=UPI00386233D2
MNAPAPPSAPADLSPSAPAPFAPSTTALRVFAALGIPLLGVAYVLFAIVVLNQAYSGDGASGPLVGVAQTVMWLSLVSGLVALALPMSYRARRSTVWVQYALLAAGPVLAAVDFS